MYLLLYWIESIIQFLSFGVPVMLVHLCLDVFKLEPKVPFCILLVNLISSIVYWVHICNIYIIIPQGIIYFFSFFWVWSAYFVEKKLEEKKNENQSPTVKK